MAIEDLYKKFKVNSKALTYPEKEELQKLFNQLPKPLSTAELLEFFEKSIYLLEMDLFRTNTEHTWRSIIFGKKERIYKEARLRNYLELQELLVRPERAKVFMERQLKNLSENKNV